MAENLPTVLQVLPRVDHSGVSKGTFEVALALKEAGWRPIVASAGGAMLPQFQRHKIEHISLPLHKKNPFALKQNQRLLAAVAKKESVNIIHARSRAPAWSAYWAYQALLKEKRNIQFITTFHGTYQTGKGVWRRFKHWYNSVMTRGEKIIAISEFIAKHIGEIYPEAKDKVVTIPRGVDIAQFDPLKISQERQLNLLREWRVAEHLPIILLPGRITRWKGQAWALTALAQIKDLPWQCVMLGEQDQHPAYLQELQTLISDHGLEERVRILPPTSDMPAAYQLAHIVLAPSLSPEAFGRVPIEAQALGKPIIATNHGGALETVLAYPDPSFTGWLVPPNDVMALINALKAALALTMDERRDLGIRGMMRVGRDYTTTQMTAHTLRVYQSIISSSSS